MTDTDPIVFIVDDDDSVRKALTRLIKSVDLTVETFASAHDFLKRKSHNGPACLLLDIRMPGLSGLDLQDELVAAGLTLPIIFISAHGTIPLTVRAMKAGAVDFIEKPFEDQTLLDAINQSLKKDRQAKLEQAEVREIQRRADSLTPREREVFALVVSGKLNKQIAFKLGTSERTIKAHRARVMKKMQAKSLADLIRLAEKVISYPV
jgi:FixJ family two-component response regulator